MGCYKSTKWGAKGHQVEFGVRNRIRIRLHIGHLTKKKMGYLTNEKIIHLPDAPRRVLHYTVVNSDQTI